MTTPELTENNLDDGPMTSVEKDAVLLNPTAAPEHARWTVIRMKLRHGVCYPIYLVFDGPHSEAAVREKIAQWVQRGDRDWKEFRHFDVWPTRPEPLKAMLATSSSGDTLAESLMNACPALSAFLACLWLVGEAAFAQVPDTLRHAIPAPPGGMQSDGHLGASVALGSGLIVVGMPGDSTGASEAGAVKVFGGGGGAPIHVLPNPEPEEYDRFGNSVAISGTRVVVGAASKEGGGASQEDSGRVYVFDLASATPAVPVMTLPNPTPEEYEYFGQAVAINGTRVVVGAPGNFATFRASGAVYVFDLASPTPTVPMLTLPNPTPAVNENFGQAVAMTTTRVVVGAPNDSTSGFGEGRAYVYDLAWGTPTVPTQTLLNPTPSPGDNFGFAVSIDGSRVVIGAPRESSVVGQAGSAYVFDLDGGTPGVPLFTLPNPNPEVGDLFGSAAGIAGNRVIVGAYLGDSDIVDVGRAYVYDLGSGTPTTPATALGDPVPAQHDFFGTAVAIAGTIVAVGAPYDGGLRGAAAYETGSVFVYDVAGATPGVPVAALSDPSPSADDYFGWAVAMSGGRLVVGVPNDQTDGPYNGRAHVYDLASATPTVPALSLPNPAPSFYNQFGSAVAISGTRVVIGSPEQNANFPPGGVVHIFDLASATPTVSMLSLPNPVPSETSTFGYSVAIAGSRVVVGAPRVIAAPAVGGRAYVFDLASATPTVPVITLLNPSPTVFDAAFGHAVAISGARAVVGAPGDDPGAQNAGQAYVFDLTGAMPAVPVTTLPNPGPEPSEKFGWAVSIDGTRVVIGAPRQYTGASNAGSAYVYDVAGTTPTVPVATLSNPSPSLEDRFGQGVAIAGTRVVVGAPEGDTGVVRSGAAYVYDVASATPGVPIANLFHPTPESGDYFGGAVAIEGTTVAIGAPYDDTPKNNKGSAYVFAPGDPDFDDDGLLDLWEYARFGTLSGHGPLDDADGDGREELLELAFDRDPVIPDAAAGPSVVNEGGYLTLTIAKRAGVTYLGQSAATPDTAAFSAATTTVVVNNASTLKVRDNFPIGGSGSRFMRVQVTAAP